MNIDIIRKTEKRKIVAMLNERFGITKLPYLLIKQSKDKIRAFSGSLSQEDIKNINRIIRTEGFGLYFATLYPDEIRLSLDAAHLLQDQITKNVVDLNDKQAEDFLIGKDIETDKGTDGFVLLKHKDIFIGAGKKSPRGIIFNYLPRERQRKN